MNLQLTKKVTVMAHEITMGSDGILQIRFIGDVEKADIDLFMKDLNPFLEASTQTAPLSFISFSAEAGKYSSAARKKFSELNADPRIGKVAVIGANRMTRVLAHIVLKATNRNNIRFFLSEKEAVTWIKENNQ
jgi:hypothetical protein